MAGTGISDVVMRSKLQQDHKRELDQKHKWALGEAMLVPGRHSKRPAKSHSAS